MKFEWQRGDMAAAAPAKKRKRRDGDGDCDGYCDSDAAMLTALQNIFYHGGCSLKLLTEIATNLKPFLQKTYQDKILSCVKTVTSLCLIIILHWFFASLCGRQY